MTTIAYKNGFLASDTQMTDDHIRVPMRKLFLLGANAGCVAICGDVERAMGFVAWLKAGAKPEEWKKKKYKDVGAIVIDKWDDLYWYDGGPHGVPIVGPYYAMGMGHVIATAAMQQGASAMDAVRLAGSLDIYTNQDVEYYSIKTRKIKKYHPDKGTS